MNAIASTTPRRARGILVIATRLMDGDESAELDNDTTVPIALADLLDIAVEHLGQIDQAVKGADARRDAAR